MEQPDRLSDASLDQHGFDARFEWGQAGVRLLAPLADTVVIVDVLSFTTAVTVAVERGVSVYPYRFRDASAAEHARSLGAIMAGARAAGGPSLSPASLGSLAAGDRLVLPSPNGATCSVMAAEAGATVIAGCLRNATAVARFVRARGGTVAIVPAGEQWPDGALRPSFEDLIGAGAILAALAGSASLSPEARAAVAAFESARPALASLLADCASGRELIDRGFAGDVELAAAHDATGVVPILRDGAFAAA